jgi:hypothetical protein
MTDNLSDNKVSGRGSGKEFFSNILSREKFHISAEI